MSKKKSEVFEVESQILLKARETLESSSDSDSLRQGYGVICDEYERLLEEARFLTKISDKLEVKLNKANEQLESHNRQLSNEKDMVESEMGKALKTNKKLRSEKSDLDQQQNKLQTVLVIIIAILAVIFVIGIWYGYQLNENIKSKEKANNDFKAKVENLEKFNKEQEQALDSLTKAVPPAARPKPRPQPKPEPEPAAESE